MAMRDEEGWTARGVHTQVVAALPDAVVHKEREGRWWKEG